MGMRCFCAQAQKQVDKCEIYLAISSLNLYLCIILESQETLEDLEKELIYPLKKVSYEFSFG